MSDALKVKSEWLAIFVSPQKSLYKINAGQNTDAECNRA